MQSLQFRIFPPASRFNMIITLGSSFTLRPTLGSASSFASRAPPLRSPSSFTSRAPSPGPAFAPPSSPWTSSSPTRIVPRSVATLPDPPITAVPTKKKKTVELAAVKIDPESADADLAPIVMLHGVLASTKTYTSLLRRADFAPGRVKYGLDLRNHGSSPHLPGMSYTDQAADVAAALRSLGLSRAILVGHSMGGKVAMTLALTEPSLVSSLVVVDIAPVAYAERPNDPTSPTVALAAMAAVDLANCASRSDVDAALNTQGLTNAQVRAFVMTNLQKNNLGFSWKCNVEELAQGIADIVSFPEFNDENNTKYTGRTMVIRGGKSQYVPFSAMRKTTQLFPRTKLVTFSEAGHWLQAQQPDMFVQSVNSFLETVQ